VNFNFLHLLLVFVAAYGVHPVHGLDFGAPDAASAAAPDAPPVDRTVLDSVDLLTGSTAASSPFDACFHAAYVSASSGQRSCRGLSAASKRRLALRLSDCHLRLSGRTTYDCAAQEPASTQTAPADGGAAGSEAAEEASVTACVRSMAHEAYATYTAFTLHTDNLCYFFEARGWKQEANAVVGRLLLGANATAQTLAALSDTTASLRSAQAEALAASHRILQDVSAGHNALALRQESLQTMMDRNGRSFEAVSGALSQVSRYSEAALRLQGYLVGHVLWLQTGAFYLAAAATGYFLTSARRTQKARLTVVVILVLAAAAEALLASYWTDVASMIGGDGFSGDRMSNTALPSSAAPSTATPAAAFEDVSSPEPGGATRGLFATLWWLVSAPLLSAGRGSAALAATVARWTLQTALEWARGVPFWVTRLLHATPGSTGASMPGSGPGSAASAYGSVHSLDVSAAQRIIRYVAAFAVFYAIAREALLFRDLGQLNFRLLRSMRGEMRRMRMAFAMLRKRQQEKRRGNPDAQEQENETVAATSEAAASDGPRRHRGGRRGFAGYRNPSQSTASAARGATPDTVMLLTDLPPIVHALSAPVATSAVPAFGFGHDVDEVEDSDADDSDFEPWTGAGQRAFASLPWQRALGAVRHAIQEPGADEPDLHLPSLTALHNRNMSLARRANPPRLCRMLPSERRPNLQLSLETPEAFTSLVHLRAAASLLQRASETAIDECSKSRGAARAASSAPVEGNHSESEWGFDSSSVSVSDGDTESMGDDSDAATFDDVTRDTDGDDFMSESMAANQRSHRLQPRGAAGAAVSALNAHPVRQRSDSVLLSQEWGGQPLSADLSALDGAVHSHEASLSVSDTILVGEPTSAASKTRKEAEKLAAETPNRKTRGHTSDAGVAQSTAKAKTGSTPKSRKRPREMPSIDGQADSEVTDGDAAPGMSERSHKRRRIM
jgi:hypothetical protein